MYTVWPLLRVLKQNNSYCFKLSNIKARKYEHEVKNINHKTIFSWRGIGEPGGVGVNEHPENGKLKITGVTNSF